MSRVINTDAPGRKRNQEMRTCAEILRHLSQKREIDDEVKDMLAQLIFSLREINDTIEHAGEVWEKRNYWMKAEELRQNWRWVHQLDAQIYALLENEAWDDFPAVMVNLLKHLGNIKVKKFTRSADVWDGAYARLTE
jgi:hypothetical protein